MEQNYSFSIVILAEDENKTKRSYDSIRAQSIPFEKIQIIVVLLRERSVGEDFRELLRKEPQIKVIDAWKQDNMEDCLREQVQGEYVTFLKAGITYEPGCMENIQTQGKKSGAGVVAGTIKNQEKINMLIREHNVYCARYTKDTTLKSDSNLLHNMYFAYFMRREELQWDGQVAPSTWCIDVLRIVYMTVMRTAALTCEKRICVFTDSGEEAVSEWSDLLKTEEGLEHFCDRFLFRIEQIVAEGSAAYRDNAEYALIYYCMRIGSIFAKQEGAINEEFMVAVDRIMQRIQNYEKIVANKYLPKINKQYLLETYCAESLQEQSEQMRFILSPEYSRLHLLFFEVRGEQIHMEFTVQWPAGRECAIYCETGGKKQHCPAEFLYDETKWADRTIGITNMYRMDFALEEIKGNIAWYIEVEGHMRVMQNVDFYRYTPFSKKVDLYIKVSGSVFYLNHAGNKIVVRREGILAETGLAIRRCYSFLKGGKAGGKAVIARIIYSQRKKRQKKGVWLVSDRTNRADDNGEVMFQYICEHPDDGIDPYFVIDKDADDWERMQKMGKVVAPFSKEHKLLFLLSEFSLSSQANKAVINPFGRLEYYYRDLMYDKRLVFLQHGITKDNQSKWLNKYNRNLFGFVVTTKPEYDSVFTYDYYYTAKQVWLTGMPRYDRLYHNEKKYVTIMPTWRKSLSAGTDEAGVWLLGEQFKSSEYFQFYNTLLNHEDLLKAAQKNGYQICFMPHPNTTAGLKFFEHNPEVKFFDVSDSYRDIFAQTDLMITDYSSVAFDFAYLRKPIVYTQFDKEEFFNGEHSYTEGYFDYERDGFGEVAVSLEETVRLVIDYMENFCEIKKLYADRVDKTFAFDDKECCQRVYETIINYRFDGGRKG